MNAAMPRSSDLRTTPELLAELEREHRTVSPFLTKLTEHEAAALFHDAGRAHELAAEVERLRDRLEMRIEDINGNPVPWGPDFPDGIQCRDETIREQDARIERLRNKAERLKAENVALANENADLRAALVKLMTAERDSVLGEAETTREIKRRFFPAPDNGQKRPA